MNSSALETAVCRYLSVRDMPREAIPDSLIRVCLGDLEQADSFRAVYAAYDEPLPFLQKEPYLSFLEGTVGYFVIACTLGVEVDREIRRLSMTDMQKMLVYDACANAYLEWRAEAWKKSLAPVVSYTFCPGYGGSSIDDLQEIFQVLHPSRIGMELTPSGLMLPQKSLAGVVGCDIQPRPMCGDCVKKQNCQFKKEGLLCFQSEPN